MDNETQFVRHEPCPKCGSSDGLARYSDGHAFCFVCHHRERGTADGSAESTAEHEPLSVDLLTGLARITTTLRGITPETYDFWSYKTGELKGEKVHVANHFKDGRLIGQKLRTKDKKFKVRGKMDSLYGRWLWPKGGKRVVITEGELDALSVSQAQGNKWPVVSVPSGAQGALKSVKEALDWLESFDEVVIMFDQDDPGTQAATQVASMLKPGKAKIASLPMKDANEMLKAGLEQQIVHAIWNAAPYRPDGILTVADVAQRALEPPSVGLPWFIDKLTEVTYGRREGETYFLGAGTGVGKTDILTEQIAYDIEVLQEPVGVLFLEQSVAETVQRVAGKLKSKRFHVPNGGWKQEELVEAVEELQANNKLFLYDNFGATDWATVKERITYMATACGCRLIYLDHLTALAAAEEDERKALEQITAEMAMLAKRLKIILHVVSHLATPDTGSHEEGARVTIRQFKGSRAIGFWAHFMFGLERDQHAEEEHMRHVTTFRILKDRFSGQATGQTIELTYDKETGRIRVYSPLDVPVEEGLY